MASRTRCKSSLMREDASEELVLRLKDWVDRGDGALHFGHGIPSGRVRTSQRSQKPLLSLRTTWRSRIRG